MNIETHLLETRNGLAEIETMTKNLGEDPSLEAIETVLKLRDTLVSRMKNSTAELTEQNPEWLDRLTHDQGLRSLFDESVLLLKTVSGIDSVLAGVIESRMQTVRQKLSFMYHASRATSSYTFQNSFRIAR